MEIDVDGDFSSPKMCKQENWERWEKNLFRGGSVKDEILHCGMEDDSLFQGHEMVLNPFFSPPSSSRDNT